VIPIVGGGVNVFTGADVVVTLPLSVAIAVSA
jgi:hypothetical protein